ncbi:MAG: hypothetical protein WD738_19910 [Pirellulales bacterium]
MVSIQLQDSVAAALTAQAEQQGLTLEEYLARLANGAARASTQMSADDVEREFEELSLDVPPLPADFSRADIYLDHD